LRQYFQDIARMLCGPLAGGASSLRPIAL
jgi:hypothetical protein